MRFGASVAVYSVATLIARSGQVAMLAIFPFFLSPTQYGVLGLLNAVAAFVNMLPLEVSQGMARNLADSEGTERASFVGTAWWFTLLTMAGGGIVMLVAAPTLGGWLSADTDIAIYLRLAAGFFVATTLVYFTQTLFRWEMRVWDFFWASVAQALLPLGLAVAGALMADDRLAGVIAGQTIGIMLVLAWSLWRLRGALWARIDRAKLSDMLRFSLPLVPGSLAVLLGVYGSRFVVNDEMPLSDVGRFFFASQLATIPSLVILGVQAALMPHVYAHHQHPDTPRLVSRVFEIVTAVGLLMALAMGLLIDPVLHAFGYDRYAGVGLIVLLLAPAFLMQQMYIFGPGFALARRTIEQMWVAILGGVSSVAFSVAMVKPFGLVGAALATMTSAALFLGIWLWRSGRHYPVPMRGVRIGLALLVFAALAAVGFEVAGGGVFAGVGLVLVFALAVAALGLVHLAPLRGAIAARRNARKPT